MFRLFAYPKVSALVRVCLLVIFASMPIALFVKARSVTPELKLELVEAPPSAPVEEVAATTVLPNFDAITNTEVKKEVFFSYFDQIITAENERILQQRETIQSLANVLATGGELNPEEKTSLAEIAALYRLKDSELDTTDLVAELLVRVDIIPVSLALAQAATESAWGTSRFAREGNNIFGQWCFDEGCGLVPGRRAEDKSHEVKAFASVEASIRAYLRNLNTNPSYEYLREIRAHMRLKDKPLDSRALAQGLVRYSERGHVYIAELHDIIRINDLLARDGGQS